MTSAARAQIRLGAIKKNLETIRSRSAGARVMAVVKANAYGHGLIPVSKALGNADALAVARISEALALRNAGIDTPITVLGGALSAEDTFLATEMSLQICVHCDEQITWLEKSSAGCVDVWLKVDTGMHRLGLDPADAGSAVARLSDCSAVGDIGLMTHLANADDTNDPATHAQVSEFARVAETFKGNISIANSAGIFGWPEIIETFVAARQQNRLWVRPGISLYGISPLRDQTATDLGLCAAMQLESRLIAVKALKIGERVGYGGTWLCERDTKVGVVSLGYGDGYPRAMRAGSALLINGRNVPLIGRVSMDLISVDLGADADDRVGDIVVLWGDELPVEEVADFANTIPYTLVSNVSERVERVYGG